MRLLVITVLAVSFASARVVLFEDDFSDGNYDGWITHSSGATYQVNSSGRFELSYNGSGDVYAFAYRGDNGETMSVQNYSVLLETIVHSPSGYAGVNLRHTVSAGTCYDLYLKFTTGEFFIMRYDSFVDEVLLGEKIDYPGGFMYDTPYHVRFECSGDSLRAKIWDTGTEPAGWMIIRVDGTYINNGCIALEALPIPSGTVFNIEYDNVSVTSVPDVLAAYTWAAIKRSF